ncbi:MAG TPA: acyltransferase [Kofleriaceae bacterium]|nr:acyltransferase [Kofleriaceae bacterium]
MSRSTGLDAARGIATLLVIVAHASIAYMVTPIGWAVQDADRHLGFDVFVWLQSLFLMQLFFWLSGFVSRAKYERGAAGFVRSRAARLLLPFLVALVPCSLALDALWDWGRELAQRGVVPVNVPKLEGSSLPITLGHLWFLYYLLAASALALVVVPLWHRLRLSSTVAYVVVLALIVVPLIDRRMLRPDVPLGFRLDPHVLSYYGGCFAWGWLAHGTRELEQHVRWTLPALVASSLLLGAIAPVAYASADPANSAAIPIIASVAAAVLMFALVIAFVGLCLRLAHRRHRIVELAADASYWAYIVHLPIVVLLQVVASTLDAPSLVEVIVIATISFAVSIATYAIAKRLRRRHVIK